MNNKIIQRPIANIETVVVREYGPREYWIFGRQEVLRTMAFNGRHTWSDMLVEFTDNVELGKNYVLTDDEYEYNVMAKSISDDNITTCCVNYVRPV